MELHFPSLWDSSLSLLCPGSAGCVREQFTMGESEIPGTLSKVENRYEWHYHVFVLEMCGWA
jgi:hypothetical protein